jgi:excisionase family DNA binding protein
MDNINLNQLNMPLSELKMIIADEVNKALKALGNINPTLEKRDRFLSRKEAATVLEISLPTLSNYTKTGLIQGYKLGGSVRYKMQDLESSLIQIKNN